MKIQKIRMKTCTMQIYTDFLASNSNYATCYAGTLDHVFNFFMPHFPHL